MTIVLTILPEVPLGSDPLNLVSYNSGNSFCDGLVVQFASEAFDTWVGIFPREINCFDKIFLHPNGEHAIIISGGMYYVIDPRERVLIQKLGGDISYAEPLPKYNGVLLGNGIEFEMLKDTRIVWNSSRISWDGMRDIRILDNDELAGEAYSPLDLSWHPFKVNLLNGECTDSVYVSQMSKAIPLVLPDD